MEKIDWQLWKCRCSSISKIEVGDKVKVMRQIGKHGIPTETNGTIKKFSGVVTIGGERTAFVQCEDEKEGDGYWYPLSKIQLSENQIPTTLS